MNSRSRLNTVFGGLALLLAAVLFVGLMGKEWGQSVRSAGVAGETNSSIASASVTVEAVYAVLVWLAIPLAIFVAHQFRQAKKFRAIVQDRARSQSDETSIAGIPVDLAPLVQSKSGSATVPPSARPLQRI